MGCKVSGCNPSEKDHGPYRLRLDREELEEVKRTNDNGDSG